MKNQVVHVKKQAESQSPVLVLETGKPIRRVHKLGVKERQIILESLLEEFNIAKAAAKVNVTYHSVKALMERDEKFADSVNQVKEAWAENMVGIGLKVASIPTREGHADRKLFLEAYRQKEFGRKLDVQIDHKITHETAIPELSRILDRFGYSKIESKRQPEVEDAEFLEINAPEQS